MLTIPWLTAWVHSKLQRPSCLTLASLPVDINSVSLNLELPGSGAGPAEVYLIRQPVMGRGMFSLVSSVICHLHVARRCGLTAVVDFSTAFRTEYNDHEFEQENPAVHANAWEYYFHPVSPLSLEEAYSSRRILSSVRSFPDRYPVTISHVQELRDLTREMIQPREEILDDADQFWNNYLRDHKVLGVHYRGQEQKTTPYHPLSPTKEQLLKAIERAIDQFAFSRIFAVSEDADHIKAMQARFGSMVATMPHFRTRSPINAYRIHPRPKHKYLLGREILTDALILSRCHGLVSGTSTVSEYVRSINNHQYLIDWVIDNGFNATNKTFARYLWRIKDQLPAAWGGFSPEALKTFPEVR